MFKILYNSGVEPRQETYERKEAFVNGVSVSLDDDGRPPEREYVRFSASDSADTGLGIIISIEVQRKDTWEYTCWTGTIEELRKLLKDAN